MLIIEKLSIVINKMEFIPTPLPPKSLVLLVKHLYASNTLQI